MSDKEDIITSASLKDNDITHVKTISQDTSLKAARLDEITEIPNFFIFDTKDKF